MTGDERRNKQDECEKLRKDRKEPGRSDHRGRAPEFEAAIEKAYQKMRKKINVPGFRPGKAPRKIIEGMYGSGVFYEDAINDVYPGAYEAAVKEQGLEDMGHPVMDIVEVNKEKGLIFTALVSVRPEAKVKAYKGLTAPKAEVSVTDEDVENELQPYVRRATRLISVDREVKLGDTAVIDFEGFEGRQALRGRKGRELQPGDRLRLLRPRLRGSDHRSEGRR